MALTEEFLSAVCGPPLSSNTAISKDVGIYSHTLSPAYSVKGTFKKSSAPVHCLAASDTHVFAAQHEKAYVHAYSRLRGNQEAFVSFPERIRCIALAGDVLVLGTAEGRIMLWEVCTGRLVSTPPRHVQAVSCLAATPYYLLSGSDDSDVHVWSLAQLLQLDAPEEHGPERSLSHHRAAITALAAAQSASADTSVCVSASKDKSCILWNYHTGDALRTLLFPTFPLCVTLDPAARALFVSGEDGSLFLAELFGEQPLLGPSAEDASTVVQVSSPFGATPSDVGPASCLSASYDGTALLTGHPKGQILRWDVADNKTPVELASLNAAVTNLVLLPPLPAKAATRAVTIVKPSQAPRSYSFTAQFEPASLEPGEADPDESRFSSLLKSTGFSPTALENAIATMQQPAADSTGDQDLRRQNDELWEIVNEQRLLQKQTFQRYMEARSSRS